MLDIRNAIARITNIMPRKHQIPDGHQRPLSPYMAGRQAYVAGYDATPPGDLPRDQYDEWRRGWTDARVWATRRMHSVAT